MTKGRVVLLSSALFVLGLHAAADEPANGGQPVVLVRHCSVQYKNSSSLGCAAAGVLQEISVQLGSEVKAGQVIGHLFDRESRAAMEWYALEANSDVNIRLAEAQQEAAAAVSKSQDLLKARNLSNVVDASTVKTKDLEYRLNVEKHKHEKRAAELQFRKAEAEVKAREIVAPHDGTVVEINRKPGETVRPGDSVFHLVDTHHVLIEGEIDVSDAWRVSTGCAVVVTPEFGAAAIPFTKKVFDGRLVFIDRRIDSRRQSCRVIAEVDNPEGLLRAGLRSRMEIQLQGPTLGRNKTF